jgi:colicin import membrane protein
VAEQYRVSYGDYDSWVVPLNLAVGFHLIIAFGVLFLPGIFNSKPKFEDIYTVDLVNLSEPVIEQSGPPAPAPEPVVQPPPPVPEKAVAIVDPVKAPAPEPVVAEPVSLKPSKRKIKKKVSDPQPDRSRELERVKRQRLAEAVRAEQLAAEQARIAAEEAERQRRLMDAQLSQIRSQVRTTPAPRRAAGQTRSSALSSLEKQYFISVTGRIMQYWTLPEFKQFDDAIQAIYVIRISRDGTIVEEFFEQRSNDPTFDQFVKKAVKDASPLPPIPPAIKGSSIEFGLRFRPGNIQ